MTEKDLNNVREAIILAALKVIQRVSDETNSVKKCPAEIEILPELIKAITPLLHPNKLLH